MLTAESEHDVLERFVRWRKELGLRGLKVNMEKTKMMVTGRSSTQKIKTGKCSWGCCGKGVGLTQYYVLNVTIGATRDVQD